MEQKPEHDQLGENLESLFKKSKPIDVRDPLAGSTHPEAFKLMLYASGDYAVVETLWNSRDGVTPFVVGSRVTYSLPGQEKARPVELHVAHEPVPMTHILWGGDIRASLHVPNIGDRIFVDLTEARALEIATEYVGRYWDGDPASKIPPMFAEFKLKADAIDHFADDWLKPGTPDVVEVTAAMQSRFLEARKEYDARIAAALDTPQNPIHGGGPAGTPTRFA